MRVVAEYVDARAHGFGAPCYRILPSSAADEPDGVVGATSQLVVLTSQLVHLQSVSPIELYSKLLSFLVGPPTRLHAHLGALDIGGHTADQKLPACALLIDGAMASSKEMTLDLRREIAKLLGIPHNFIDRCLSVDTAEAIPQSALRCRPALLCGVYQAHARPCPLTPVHAHAHTPTPSCAH